MSINRERARQWLKAFDFHKLFIEELGWDNLSTTLVKQIDGADYRFHSVAEKRGVVVLVSDFIPDYAIRVKLDKLIAKDHFEHLIVFTDKSQARQVWQWVTKGARNWLGNKLDATKRSQIMFMDRDDILNLYVVNNLPLPSDALPEPTKLTDDDIPF